MRGVTLVELMVVMVLIAILSGIVGPSIANRLENLSLQTAATQLAAQLRKAQAEARVSQTPVIAGYAGRKFRFMKETKEIGAFSLPDSVSVVFENGIDTLLLLPSGQVAGAENLQLVNRRGRKATIQLSWLEGITAVQGTR
jgi:type II secretion system protein H